MNPREIDFVLKMKKAGLIGPDHDHVQSAAGLRFLNAAKKRKIKLFFYFFEFLLAQINHKT